MKKNDLLFISSINGVPFNQYAVVEKINKGIIYLNTDYEYIKITSFDDVIFSLIDRDMESYRWTE